MAKVEGPLFSLEARGKIGNAIVFTPWKGRHSVRQWLKPTNPKSTTQGYVRATLKAISKWIKKVGHVGGGDALDSVVYQAFTASAPAGQNWNAYAGKGLMDLMQVANTFLTASFAAVIAEYSSLNTTDLVAFETNATALGLTDFTFSYGYTTEIPAGLQLFFGAKACYAASIVGAAPYNTDPASWVVSDVDDFKEDMTSDA
jgi:hypothetical protein